MNPQLSPVRSAKASCRICSGTCGFSFQVENNQIIDYFADTDNPMTKGHCCPKGIAGIEMQQGKGNRLTESLKRNTAGEFETIDTLDAAEEIGQKLKAIVDEHGPRSVAMFFGTGAYVNTLGNAFSKAWLHAIGSPNFFSTMTIDQSSHWVTIGRMGMFLGGMPDFEDIDVGLISGANTYVSHLGWPGVPAPGVNPGEGLRRARERGQKLIVVDPRVTETASNASLHLQIIPGEDATLYAGIIHLLFKQDVTNKEFCERYVTHVERLKELVSDYTPEYGMYPGALVFPLHNCKPQPSGWVAPGGLRVAALPALQWRLIRTWLIFCWPALMRFVVATVKQGTKCETNCR